jgi:hypothetical protein
MSIYKTNLVTALTVTYILTRILRTTTGTSNANRIKKMYEKTGKFNGSELWSGQLLAVLLMFMDCSSPWVQL